MNGSQTGRLKDKRAAWSSAIQNILPLLCAFYFVASCSSTKFPAAPLELSDDSDATSYGYTIGAGDTLNIFVWGYEDLSDSVPVGPDGQITSKLVEDLQASGKTTSELALEIKTRYADFVKQPVVTVSVDSFVGTPSQQVKIVGASTEPKSVPYVVGMALLDVIIEVGGIAEFADGNRSTLVRKEGGENVNYSLRIDDLVRDGDVTANVPLLPGDIVIIPESRF
ncbi:polysaccharide export protein [Granulosicoccus sp.]|nr:polysaccharide export protein [Granulosicoccus sp.]